MRGDVMRLRIVVETYNDGQLGVMTTADGCKDVGGSGVGDMG